jgi:hypothetical protein
MIDVASAGEYDVEGMYDDSVGDIVIESLVVTCPHCRHEDRPFAKTQHKQIDGGWRWVGDAYKEPYVTWSAVCSWCGETYTLTTHSPQ